MPLTVIGIRHGEVHNPEGIIYSGLPGYGLSNLGRNQARQVADAVKDMNIVALYASPLDRAIETAQAIADVTGAEVRPDIRLHEWRHWAQWAGMTWEELRTKGRDAWEMYRSDPGSVTTGESLEQLADRVESWLADVERDYADGVVIGVAHLEPWRAILLRRLGLNAAELHDLTVGLGQAVRLLPTTHPEALSPQDLASAMDTHGESRGVM